MIDPFEVFALNYARHGGRSGADNFLGGDPHEAGADLAYYVWVLRRADRLFLIDTGFGPQAAQARGRHLLHRPRDLLAHLGLQAASITDVVLTHVHYDHAGTLEDFPKATFHVQEAEMAFATGRCMCEPSQRAAYDVEDVVRMLRLIYGGRVVFHAGDAVLCEGVTLHHIPGHTAGLMAVRVWTRRGWVVLASDASHLYENLTSARPFSIVQDAGAQMEGFRRLFALGGSTANIVPGHDPLVIQQYPSFAGSPDILALHEAPKFIV